MNSVKGILFFGLVPMLVMGGASPGIKCDDLFTSIHFPESSHKKVHPDEMSSQYSEWSADVSNKAYKILDTEPTNERKIESLFFQVSNARKQLQIDIFDGKDADKYSAIDIHDPDSMNYGRPRPIRFGNVTVDKANHVEEAGHSSKLAFELTKTRLPDSIDTKGFSHFDVEHSYTDMDGKSVPLKTLAVVGARVEGKKAYFSFSSYTRPFMPERGFKVAKQRLIAALDSQDPNQSIREFTKAAYVYFASMPYKRGSAATGRIVFSAVAKKLFGRTLSLNSEIDIHALLSSEGDFESWLQQDILRQLQIPR